MNQKVECPRLGAAWPPLRSDTRFQTQLAGSFERPRGLPVRGVTVFAPPQRFQFLVIHGRVNQLFPVCRLLDRARAEEVWFDIRTYAGPAPIGGSQDQIGSDRISLNVAHHGKQVSVLLNWKRFEPTLPDTSGCSPKLVIATHMRGEQPLHPAAEIAVLERPKYEVEVIRHQTEGENPERQALIGSFHQPNERPVVGSSVIDGRSSISSIDNVVADATFGSASGSGHAAIMRINGCCCSSTISTMSRKSRMSPLGGAGDLNVVEDDQVCVTHGGGRDQAYTGVRRRVGADIHTERTVPGVCAWPFEAFELGPGTRRTI